MSGLKRSLLTLALLPILSSVRPASAQALGLGFDTTPDTTRIVSDPAFLPLAGQVFGETSFGHTQAMSTLNFVGSFPARNDALQNYVNQYLSYGVTDRLSLNLEIEYAKTNTTQSSAGGNFIFRNVGFTNPSFGATYRVIEQGRAPLNLDLDASVSPDTFSARASTASTGGTTAFGATNANFHATVSRELKSFTAAAIIGMNYFGDQSTRIGYTNFTENFSDSVDYYLQLATQTRFTDRFAFNFGGSIVQRSDYSRTDASYGQSYTISSGLAGSVSGALEYHVIPNKVVLGLAYEHDFPADLDFSGSSIGTYRDRDEDFYVIHVRYLLN